MSCLPPNCVYPCFMSHTLCANSSTGMSSLYWSRCRCADSRAKLTRELASAVSPATPPMTFLPLHDLSDLNLENPEVSRIDRFTHEVSRNIFSPLAPNPPSFPPERSNSFPVTFFSAASTTPSFARMPRTVPACEIASMAYSTVQSIGGAAADGQKQALTLVKPACG